ncbi:hypothetical protein [Actinomadura violacea]|uniref:Uncharacterized protein n=1 Tax=Actinomadura violacea TaxID=2819934 RepID=A0ABS3RXL3_9ACTN|nr:hypothetical protein [Actinomadura violacea]MBO2461490.1 hypothetical protein [Actinomadura violacea]
MSGPLPPQRVHDDADPAAEGSGDAHERLVRHLRAAELYWVSKDMAALAVHAGAQLAATAWGPHVRPAPCGLLHVDGGIGSLPVGDRGRLVPADGLLWGPHPDGLAVVAYLTRQTLAAHLAERDLPDRVGLDGMPPLLFIGGDVLPVGREVSMAEVDPGMRTVLAALAAAWHLMQQPTLADRSRADPDKPARTSARKADTGDPAVTVIDLRRRYRPDDREETGVQDGRRFRHRWVVSGHWRDQPHGPDRALRRKTWIAAYIKGPEGAPLLATERVNVWRH